MSRGFVSVLGWEVVDLQNIVVFVMLRLAMCERYDEESRFDFLNGFALR